MSHVVSDSVISPRGARVAAAFKDGVFIRRVEARPGNVLVVLDTEGNPLYVEYACPENFAILSIDAQTSSFSGTLIWSWAASPRTAPTPG